MESEQTGMENVSEPSAPSAGAGVASGRRGRGALIRTIVLIVLGVALVLAVFDTVTASPRLCASCHEMRVRAASWQQSSHIDVPCVSCHQTPRPWYAYPLRLVDRSKLLVRDVRAHLASNYPDPVDARVPGMAPMSDDVCLQCHSPNRRATSGFRIKIDHVEHAKRNGSCVSCHVRTAHPLATRGTPLTLMSQCFTCHGTAEHPDATSACTVCHPMGYKLIPESHEDKAWKPQKHASTAKNDPKQCAMCHQQSFCDDCHGLEMPHPEDWSKGQEGHAAYAEADRTVCSQCHTEKPDLCSMCHHKTYDPVVGSWVKQHYIEVETHGAEYCLECHAPGYCVRCHVSWATTGQTTE